MVKLTINKEDVTSSVLLRPALSWRQIPDDSIHICAGWREQVACLEAGLRLPVVLDVLYR